MYTGIEFEQGTPEMAGLTAFIERSIGKRIREDSGLSIKSVSVAGSKQQAG